MLRELEEAVKRGFRIASDREDTRIVAGDWESRLHISQVGKNNAHSSDENVLVAILRGPGPSTILSAMCFLPRSVSDLCRDSHCALA